jgi:hypothetical protein
VASLLLSYFISVGFGLPDRQDPSRYIHLDRSLRGFGDQDLIRRSSRSCNLLNNQKLIQWDTTVTPDNNGPRDALGIPLNYIKGSRFGQGTLNTHYPTPLAGETGGRWFQFAFGVRF